MKSGHCSTFMFINNCRKCNNKIPGTKKHIIQYGNYCIECDIGAELSARVEAKKQSLATKRIILLLTLYHKLPDKKII